MGITTKTGDKGRTSLLGGMRVSKDHVIIRTCAHLDDLCSFLGLAKSLLRQQALKKLLERIQKDLYVICAEVAAEKKLVKGLKQRINNAHIKRLERKIRDLEGRLKLKKSFTLPGKNFVSGLLDVARARTRSTEVNIVTLRKRKLLLNNHVLIYLNRLSDLLYLLSRACEKSRRNISL